MRTRLRPASLVVFAALLAGCAFPDVSMVAPTGSSGDAPPADGSGDPTGDAFPLADGGPREGDARGVDAGDAASPVDAAAVPVDAHPPVPLAVDAAAPNADAADAEAPAADAVAPSDDAVAPSVEAGPPTQDAAIPADAGPPTQDAANGVDAVHDAGHVKQYPANVDCGSLDVGDCNSTIGFVDDPACGDTGTLVQCGTSTTRDNNGNGNGNGDDEASRNKDACVILLEVTAVQTCL